MQTTQNSPYLTPSWGIITMAYGKPQYVEYAKNLALSLKRYTPHIPTAIVTDSIDPKLPQLFNQLIPLRKEFGKSMVQKLHLDYYSPFENTLYIDSDCLLVRNLDEFVPQLMARSFAIPGQKHLVKGDPDWCMDNDFIFEHFNLKRLPKFNGGVIWFKCDETAQRIFEQARELCLNFKDLHFHDLYKGEPNDEPIWSVAMALHGEDVFADRARMMRTIIGIQSPLHIDVLKGECSYRRDNMQVEPAICHFVSWREKPIYRREVRKLRFASSNSSLLRSSAGSLASLLYVWETANITIRQRLPKVGRR